MNDRILKEESYKIIDTAIQAAIKAGKEILKIYNDPKADFSVEKKADNSPLTAADKASHNEIEKYLLLTSIPILSEEGIEIDYSVRKLWKTFWLIDPLDGTKEFIKKNDEFTVNIALISKGKPVLGIIYIPVTQTLYIGKVGEGAWKMITNNSLISFEEVKINGTILPQITNQANFTVVGSRTHMNTETKDYINKLKTKHSQIDIISRGSSLKICMVAEGLANEYPRFGPTMEWDTAAGHAIANAAGKKIWSTNLDQELHYNKENLLNPYFIVK